MQLSPSALSIHKDCPRCFVLDRKLKTKRPRGIFPSLPGGMDRILKDWSDHRRFNNDGVLEPLERDFPNLVLFDDEALVNRWRNWRTGPKFTDGKGNILTGAVDDVLVDGDVLVPFDYKTKGSEPDDAYCEKYYQAQLDNYALMMQAEGYEVANYGILLYVWPKETGEWNAPLDHAVQMHFDFKAFKLDVSTQRAEATFKSAIDLLNKRVLPAAGDDCEYCKTFYARQQVEVSLRNK